MKILQMNRTTVEAYSKRKCPICGFYYFDESVDITTKCACPRCHSRMRIIVISRKKEPVCQKY